MFDHLSIAVTDIPRARAFYDVVLAELDIPRVGLTDSWIGYGLRADSEHPGRVYLSLLQRDKAAGFGGLHWCFKAESREMVDRFWGAGLAHGGCDDGAPGIRAHYHPYYYAAFLRDPDGNRLEAVCHRPNP